MGMQTAVILAGGRGTRLAGVVQDVPKPMADVHGRPFLAYQIRHLQRQGIQRVVLSVGYKADVIEAYFKDGSDLGLEILYAREDAPLGTGGALRNCLPYLEGPTIVLNGDTYQPIPVQPLVDFHAGNGAELTVVVTPVAAAEDYGSIAFEPGGRIRSFAEKLPGGGHVNAGCYCVEPAMLANLPTDRAVSLEVESIPGWIAEGRACYAWETATRFYDIGTPERYRSFQKEILTLEH